MKKLLAMVLALVMTLSLAVSANAAFKDADKVSADYSEAVAVLNGMGVFKGYEDGSFQPQGNITRAEVAAIVYRVYTADVKDAKASLYATYNKFSDMAGAGWAQGYIGYCANAALVKGYPNGTFQPSGKVTGYEVLAMILRAIGYDQNNEFTGADWALHVAQTAQQAGVLKNVKGVDLNAPATRELVAEILFRAIQQPMVTYTPAFGYVTDKVANIAQNTLAKKNFNLDSKDSEDKWGRPSTKWYNTKTSKTYAEVVATPDASYNVATAQCDICSALGEKTSAKIVETYTNGVKSTAAETYKATATKAMVGAQGEQIEFYELKDGGYRLVIIDTYLAQVDKVVEEETDKGGHVTQDDYIKMTAFAPSGAKFASPIYAEGNDYAKDAYVLVNVNEAKANNVEFVGLKGEQNYVEVVGAADSVVAAQTIVWRNANQHTLDGKEYDDAVMLALNEAGTTKDVKYTWFFDQFGNVIGSVGLDRSSYAVLRDLTWVGTGKNGHAEATLITFDGSATEKTVTVNKIDGFDSATHYKWVEDQKGAVPYLRDNRGNGFEVAGSKAYAQVGEDDGSNTYYLGLALYSVETLDDDSVNLKGIDYVDAVEKATLNVKTGAIIYGANNSKVFVTDDTQFIVRTEDAKGNYKYEAFTGTDKLAKMADGTIDVMFSEKDSKNVVDYVYITEYTPAELNAHLLYTFETQYSVNEKENKYGMKVILDGKEETVYTHNEDIMKALSDGQNMLYKVTIDTNTAHDTYGEILSIDLINEATDGTIDSTDKVYVDYVTGGAELSGKRILVGYEAYTVNEDTKVVLADGTVGTIADLKAKDVETKGIWVVHDNKAAPTASCVYVGEKLGDEAAATVYVNGVAVKFEQAATPFSATVTGDLGAAAKVTAEAADKNAVVTI